MASFGLFAEQMLPFSFVTNELDHALQVQIYAVDLDDREHEPNGIGFWLELLFSYPFWSQRQLSRWQPLVLGRVAVFLENCQ